jgi:hypothetical protein
MTGIRSLILAIGLLIACSVSAQTPLTLPVHLVLEQSNLQEALDRLLSEIGAAISFSPDLLPSDRRYSRSFQGQPLSEVLDYLLEDSGLSYSLVGRQVVLFRISPERKPFTISGFIEDRFTGEKLIGAAVFDPISLRGAVSNHYGYYSLTLPEGIYQLRISYLGYRTEQLVLDLNRAIRRDIRLEADGMLSEVIVTSPSDSVRYAFDGRAQDLDLQAMRSLPALGGEPDLIRFAALQPGVLTGTDGFGGVHVRGGNADQNLFLLDGVPVYNPSHAAGMFSIFNSQAIRSARMYKGGFPARYGGRLSSVFDVHTKEGNNQRLQGEAGISLLSARIALEGPIDPETSSFFLSARRTLFDPWLRSATRYVHQERGNSGLTDFHFYDLHGKMNFRSGTNHRFYISLYHGQDQFHQEESRSVRFRDASLQDNAQSDLEWGNTVASFRWNWILHPNWFLNTTVYSSSFTFGLLDFYEFTREEQGIKDRRFDLLSFSSLIQDTGLRLEGEFHAGNGQTIRFGGGVVRHGFQPGVMALDENTIDADVFVSNGRVRNLDSLPRIAILRSLETECYLEDHWLFSPDWSLNAGLYFNHFLVQESAYLSLQPRAHLRWHPDRRFGIGFSYGHMAQNLHLLTNSGLGLPTDLWAPVTGNVRPLQARQMEVDMILRLHAAWTLELSAYHKAMNNILAWRDEANFLVNGNILQGGVPNSYWESLVTSGEGTARGLECALRFEGQRFQGGLAYSLARTEHRFSEINGGRSFPFRYDRTHTLHLHQQWKVNERLRLNMLWSYATGQPITIPVGRFEVHSPYYIAPGTEYSGRNAFRMADYHRLDITMQYTHQNLRWHHTLDLGVYNLYNRHNPQFIRVRENIYNPEQRDLVQVSLLPILPVLSYQLAFR